MSEDSSSSQSRDFSSSPAWLSTQTIDGGPRCSVVRTTEKSVVFRVRTQEHVPGTRGRRSQKMLRLTQHEDTSGANDSDVHEMLAELYTEAEAKKQWLQHEEESFERGQERLKRLQREHEELLHSLEQCKRRRKERIRIRKMLRGPKGKGERYERERHVGSSSDSDYNSHRRQTSNDSSHHRRRDGAKKERKRLRQFQSEVSLRFQLLQSECQRHKLEVEKTLAEVRSKYTDSYLFGNTLNF